MSTRKFFKTVVEVEVLSEDEPAQFDTLSDLYYHITEGHCSGTHEVKSSEEVSAKVMAKLLKKQGSDPEFFRLSEDGEELEEKTLEVGDTVLLHSLEWSNPRGGAAMDRRKVLSVRATIAKCWGTLGINRRFWVTLEEGVDVVDSLSGNSTTLKKGETVYVGKSDMKE